MPPDSNPDFEDLVEALTAEECEYVIVGGFALAAHGAPRATGDLDVFIRAEPLNAERVVRALQRFGAPLNSHGVHPDDFATPGTVYQMGLPPRRIDILTEISGVTFDEARALAVPGKLGSREVPCIGLEAMIQNKRASGRPKDLADVEVLEALREKSADR